MVFDKMAAISPLLNHSKSGYVQISNLHCTTSNPLNLNAKRVTKHVLAQMRISAQKRSDFGDVERRSYQSNLLKISDAFGGFCVELFRGCRDQLLLVLQRHQLLVRHRLRGQRLVLK